MGVCRFFVTYICNVRYVLLFFPFYLYQFGSPVGLADKNDECYFIDWVIRFHDDRGEPLMIRDLSQKDTIN